MSSFDTELRGGAFQLGVDLAAKGQYIDDAVTQLNINLATIGCEPNVDAAQVHGPSWRSISLVQNSPPFTRAVRGAVSSIIYRPESLVDESEMIDARPIQDHSGKTVAAWFPGEDIDLASISRSVTEGITWVDPEAARYRRELAIRGSGMIKAMLGGLASNGYAKRLGKRDAREEFYEQLDGMALRTSYHITVERRVVANMMRKAGLWNVANPYHVVKRQFQAFDASRQPAAHRPDFGQATDPA